MLALLLHQSPVYLLRIFCQSDALETLEVNLRAGDVNPR